MRNYLDKNMYVKTEDNLIYKVDCIETFNNGCDYMIVRLKLIAGWDYVNPNENDIQGWCKADNFIEELQDDFINCYFLVESVEEALKENCYYKIEKLPYGVEIVC